MLRLALPRLVERWTATWLSSRKPWIVQSPGKTYRIGLGEQISALSNDSVAGTLNVTELS